MKTIIHTHQNPLLENFESLQQTPPEKYDGFIYLWKCIPEDMFYVGSHKGIANDEYRGSGARFKRVFEHYGITQFKRVVIEYVPNEKDIKIREQQWMNKFRAKKSPRFYNTNNVVAAIAI
jgi:hypothetical protein